MVPEYRWEELEVKVFNGNVENFNECLEDCEALVLTEVRKNFVFSQSLNVTDLEKLSFFAGC